MFKLIKESEASKFAWDEQKISDVTLAISELIQRFKAQYRIMPNWLIINDVAYDTLCGDFPQMQILLDLYGIGLGRVSCVEGMHGLMAAYMPPGFRPPINQAFVGYPSDYNKINKQILHMLPAGFGAMMDLLRIRKSESY